MSRIYNLDDIVFILKDIYDGGDDCHPLHRIAVKGDVVKVRRVPSDPNLSYVSHAGYSDESFLVYSEEISFYDPLITHIEQDEYRKAHNYKTLDERLTYNNETFILGEKNDR